MRELQEGVDALREERERLGKQRSKFEEDKEVYKRELRELRDTVVQQDKKVKELEEMKAEQLV